MDGLCIFLRGVSDQTRALELILNDGCNPF